MGPAEEFNSALRGGLSSELAEALRLSLHVMSRRPFWRVVLWQLLAHAVIGALTLLPLMQFLPEEDASLLTAGLLVMATVLAPPILSRICCPAIARAVAAALAGGAAGSSAGTLPERALPGLFTFALWWSCVLLLLALPFMLAWSATGGAPMLLYPIYFLTALVLALYQARCALCVHAGTRELRRQLFAARGRLTLVLMALTLLPFAASAGLVRAGVMDVQRALPLQLVFNAFWYVALSTLWAALYLRRLASDPAADSTAPPLLPLRRARPRLQTALPLAALLALILAGSYQARLFLIHRYLSLTDITYRSHALDVGGDGMRETALGNALHEAACTNNLPRLRLLLRAGAAPENGDLHRSLVCAVRAGHREAVTYLVQLSGEPNAAPRSADRSPLAPRSALQHAVSSGRADMVALLLSLGADPALQFDSAGMPLAPPIQIAAFKRDFRMVVQLIKAGADPQAAYPAPPMFMVVDGAAHAAEQADAQSGMRGGEDSAAPDWNDVLDKAVQAGLSLSARDQHGRTLLHWAAWKGQSRLVVVLLTRGMDRLAEDRARAQPFMYLLAWYGLAAEQEPGREFEGALAALVDGVPELNRRTPQAAMDDAAAPRIWREGWSIAQTAARRPRVRAALGRAIDYSTVGARDWPFRSAAEAEALIADLSDSELLAAASLSAGLRQQGWTELAVLVEQRTAAASRSGRRQAPARG